VCAVVVRRGRLEQLPPDGTAQRGDGLEVHGGERARVLTRR
jgi:hypothetical protein